MNAGWWQAGAAGLVLSVVLAQLALGADVIVLALSVTSMVIGLYPITRVGFDLYTIFAALFWFRYTGGVLFAKTLYLQPLDHLLKEPVESYALSTLLVGVVVAIVLLARRWDKGTSMFTPMPSTRHARQVGLLTYGIGAGAGAIVGVASRQIDGNAGPLFVISSALIALMYLGYAAEAYHTVAESKGRRLISPRLAGMLTVTIAMALFLNVRALAVNSVICVFLCGLMFRAIKPRHLALGAVLGFVFTSYVSPLALELRVIKEDKSAIQFASEVVELVARTVTEPGFIAELQRKEAYRSQYESGTLQYDYFGDGSNILNRMAFVALLDAVYAQTQVLNPIGTRALTEQVVPRNAPSFLVEKEARAYGYGDWLSWEIGLIETGRSAYLSFPLPIEGIAVFGPLLGVTLWPVLLMLPVLIILGKISTFRAASATSLFLLSAFHWELIEAPSEGYIGFITRGLPITVLPAWALYWLWAHQGASSTNNPHRLGVARASSPARQRSSAL